MRIAVNLILIILLVEYCTGEDILAPFEPFLGKVDKALEKVISNAMEDVGKCLEQRYCFAGVESRYEYDVGYPPVAYARKKYPQFGNMLLATIKEVQVVKNTGNMDLLVIAYRTGRSIVDDDKEFPLGMWRPEILDEGYCLDTFPCSSVKKKKKICFEIETTCPMIKIHCEMFGKNKAWRKFFLGRLSGWKKVYKNCKNVMADCKEWTRKC